MKQTFSWVASFLASEVLVSSSPEALGGPFRGCCQSCKTWWYNPCLCFRISRLKVFIFFYGLFQAIRWEGRLFTESCAVRSWGPLDIPLEILSFPDWVPFREWCSKILCDPTSSPLGVVADFLISRFDKGLTVVTLRSYRSAMASCLRGFSGGSFGNELCFPYPFGQVLLFEETLF